MGERIHKSLLNAEVNLVFYFLSLFLAFFSRKIFLDCLSAEFIGLTGTLNNILGYLNLAELGISGSVGYLLYKPLQQNNREEINELLSVFGFLYNQIGYIIGGAGIVVSIFFPLIFHESTLCLNIIYFSFYSILCSSLIGYFIIPSYFFNKNLPLYLLVFNQGYSLSIFLFKTMQPINPNINSTATHKYKFLYVYAKKICIIVFAIPADWKYTATK